VGGVAYAQLLERGRNPYPENYCQKDPPPSVKKFNKPELNFTEYLFFVLNMKLDVELGEAFNIFLQGMA
jgi:hypothetical protein